MASHTEVTLGPNFVSADQTGYFLSDWLIFSKRSYIVVALIKSSRGIQVDNVCESLLKHVSAFWNHAVCIYVGLCVTMCGCWYMHDKLAFSREEVVALSE